MTQPTKKETQQKKSSTQGRLKGLRTGNVIIFFIAIIPFLFYINDIFPDGSIWENSFFIYKSQYYESVNVFVWVVLGKLIPLLLFLIWFFTCKHWWYLVILIPVALYFFQLFSIIIEDSGLLNNNELFYLPPIIIIVLSILYKIRTKLFDKIHGIDLSELNTLGKSKKFWKK